MDQMIDQIKGAWSHRKPLDHIELDRIARYLMGELPLEAVGGILPKSATAWYDKMYVHSREIGEACRREPALLPRLGRHLLLIRHSNCDLYFSLAQQILQYTDLTMPEIFDRTEMGAAYLVEYLLHHDYHHRGLTNTTELLEEVWSREPQAVEQYIQQAHPPQRLLPLAYYCAKMGYDLHLLDGPDSVERSWVATLAVDIALHSIAGDPRMSRHQRERLTMAMERHCSHLVPLLQNEKLVEAGATLESTCRTLVFVAQNLCGCRLELLNQAARAWLEADCENTVTAMCNASQWFGKKIGFNISRPVQYYNESRAGSDDAGGEIASFLQEMEGTFSAAAMDPAALCAWCAGRAAAAPADWDAPFRALYGGDKTRLREAMEWSDPLAKIYLLRVLEAAGEPLPVERCRDFAVQLFREAAAEKCGEEDSEAVARWLLSGEGDPAGLPSLKEYYGDSRYRYYYRIQAPEYAFDQAACWLADVSPLAGRYLCYLSAHGHSLNLSGMLSGMMMVRHMAPEQVAGLVEEWGVQEGAILALAEQEGLSVFPGVGDILGELVDRFPDLTAGIIEGKAAADTRLGLLDILMGRQPAYDGGFLVRCLGDKSKKVRERAVGYLLPRAELAEQVRPLLEAKKKDLRAAAEQLMIAWEGEDAARGDADIMALCTRNMPGAGMAGIRWALGDRLPPVRWRESGERADDRVVLCYLSLMLSAKTMELSPAAKRIGEALDEEDLHNAARQVYDSWLADGAPAKNKGALLLMGRHAKAADLLDIQRQIDDWAGRSRGAIAAAAVRAMALGGSDIALMTVDSIGRKFGNKQVRRAGQEAFAQAAEALNTTVEALGDRIIPTLGFDERGELVVDYGTRQFTAILSTDLTIQLRDGTGKTIKSLPKPGAKDDAEMAERAKKDFAAMKKSLKAVAGTQAARLEQALATGRRWSREGWQKLFVQNPIMHCFAIGLVWGIYEGDRLVESFRYLEDGSFTGVDEEEVALEELGGDIGLVHPLDLTPDGVAAWREQLSDYEITQPIPQMERPVFRPEGEERGALTLDRFAGKRMPGITLVGKLQKLGWYRGSVQDAGMFYTFYKEVGDVGMQLYFSGMYVAPDPEEVVTIGQAGFYRAGSVERGSYVYDDVKPEEVIPLGQVSPRLLSELIHELGLATATSADTDKDWRQESGLQFFDGKTPASR